MDLWQFIFLGFLWTMSSFVCALFEGASRMSSSGAQYTTVLEHITSCSIFTADSTLGKIKGVFSTDLWDGILDMATFNYPVLYGDFAWIRILVFTVITIAVVAVLSLQVMKLIRGVS